MVSKTIFAIRDGGRRPGRINFCVGFDVVFYKFIGGFMLQSLRSVPILGEFVKMIDSLPQPFRFIAWAIVFLAAIVAWRIAKITIRLAFKVLVLVLRLSLRLTVASIAGMKEFNNAFWGTLIHGKQPEIINGLTKQIDIERAA